MYRNMYVHTECYAYVRKLGNGHGFEVWGKARHDREVGQDQEKQRIEGESTVRPESDEVKIAKNHLGNHGKRSAAGKKYEWFELVKNCIMFPFGVYICYAMSTHVNKMGYQRRPGPNTK